MRKTAALTIALICAGSLPAFAVSQGKARYIGGTIGSIQEKSESPIDIRNETSLRYAGLSIPWKSVSEIEYGQKVGHRVATAILLSPLALFKKARHHYVTINYKDSDKNEQAVVFEFDKDDIRSALATLRARTGKDITFLDDEARKQMGGGVPAKEKEKH
jgi:hypothetical protein